MLQPYNNQAALTNNFRSYSSLSLLLFIDERPSSLEYTQKIQEYLQSLNKQYQFELQVIAIEKQPNLVEHFRLITTPALVKVAPDPRQTLAGRDLIMQIKKWWDHWQVSPQQEEQKTEGEENSIVQEVEQNVSGNYSTEIMQLSDQIFRLEQEKEELLQQLKFKDHVLAMLAHDLRNPLTVASMSVETLEKTKNYPGQKLYEPFQEQLYKQVKYQFKIMNRMIQDILQASKSISGRWRLQLAPLDLSKLCQDIIDELSYLFKDKNQIVKQDIPQDIPLAHADKELIRQVIVNLLENAIKYTPENGVISVFILHRTLQKIQVSISDTGPGIPDEQKENIFQGHFRLQRDEAKEGYGLGLYLCRQIICAHYGQIWVDNLQNQGSCFHFTLPVYK